eukprot:CAMPEP_0168220074 /NCGR_PEP_ID=MMETSP0140_2-20121125/8990_1 /TAXON_ID=44445 /ORGANISM="Pseudo-nitzschia australis, Strain 10249 10 AB" /LENGTH=536 /DNA_ID=CAMNT_0008148679 /DNA_START=242 /DNA_END=1852 /DNA_ORIENTATION=-
MSPPSVLSPILALAFAAVLFLSSVHVHAITSPQYTLMDATGGLRLNKIASSGVSTVDGVVSVITSPDTESLLVATALDEDGASVLAFSGDVPQLICRGATLSGTSAAERSALAITSLVSDVIVLDGITEGDVQAAQFGKNTRHARTLTALFRARLASSSDAPASKQELIFCIKSSSGNLFDDVLAQEVRDLFEATAAEVKDSQTSFDDLYRVKVVSVTSDEEASQILADAKTDASALASSEAILASALQDANERIKESGIASVALDPPHIAHAFVAVSNAHTKQSRSARAKISSWKSRVARSHWIESFGTEAEAMRNRILSSFDSETLVAAGLPLVASYRLEMRNQLASLVDSSIVELFGAQVTNLEKRTMQKIGKRLLIKLDVTPAEDVPSENAAFIRKAMFDFDIGMSELEVPSLSLTKVKPCRDMEAKLTDKVINFSDSPAAQIKRTKKVTEAVSKEKKPGQRSLDLGLDLVAVLRPDGFGSLQGFAGYQMGGNSFTFGIHNDADDPATISQFGGVRPPLLRIQPKLRVDVEM